MSLLFYSNFPSSRVGPPVHWIKNFALIIALLLSLKMFFFLKGSLKMPVHAASEFAAILRRFDCNWYWHEKGAYKVSIKHFKVPLGFLQGTFYACALFPPFRISIMSIVAEPPFVYTDVFFTISDWLQIVIHFHGKLLNFSQTKQAVLCWC